MKIYIPKKCNITLEALSELKLQVKKLINNYDENKEYKIYLYSNFLKIIYNDNSYNVAIVEYNNELYWYMKPFYNNYLLLKKTNEHCFDMILLIIKNISS